MRRRSATPNQRPADEGQTREIRLPTAILDALAPHAARRGVHPNSLARTILQTVVNDGMVDAVLDDTHGVAA